MLPRLSREKLKVGSHLPCPREKGRSSLENLGLADVERAFVHVDYEHEHDVHEEHKPLYEKKQDKPKMSLKERLLGARTKGGEGTETDKSS